MAKDDEMPMLPDQAKLVDVLERLTKIQEQQPIPQQSMAQAKHITPWNPTGAKMRPRLKRRVFQNGHPLSDGRLHDEEILLLNGLKPGRYRNRQWLVLERDMEGTSSLHLYIPDATEAQRLENARLAPRGLADVLLLIHEEMKTPKVATE